jgi:hypothetical protein
MLLGVKNSPPFGPRFGRTRQGSIHRSFEGIVFKSLGISKLFEQLSRRLLKIWYARSTPAAAGVSDVRHRFVYLLADVPPSGKLSR